MPPRSPRREGTPKHWAIGPSPSGGFGDPPPPSNHRSCITALPLSSDRMGDHGAARCSDGMSIEHSHALGGSFPYSQGSSETTGRERADLQCREATKHHVADRTHLRNTECNTGGIPPFHKTWLIRRQPYPTAYRPSITDCRSPSLSENSGRLRLRLPARPGRHHDGDEKSSLRTRLIRMASKTTPCQLVETDSAARHGTRLMRPDGQSLLSLLSL